MPMTERSRMRCLILLPMSAEYGPVRDALKAVGKEVGVQVLSLEEAEPQLWPIPELLLSEIARADLVVAEVTQRNPNIFHEIGLAQATGKPAVFLIEEGAPAPQLDLHTAFLLTYSRTLEGLAKLQQHFGRLLQDFRRFPRRFRTFASVPSRFGPPPFIDLERLEPREFENLCFELLTQMGFRRVEWGKELREIDVVAMLPKKDPDGFEYQELWLISMGLHAPIERLLEMAFKDPDFLLHRILRRPESSERLGVAFKPDTPITLLFILFRDHPSPEVIDREFKRMERRLRERPLPFAFTLRVRIWDRQKLTNLVQQYPQILYKYFSEEGRAQSKYRKSPEDLYRENVELTERLQATLSALQEERDKRIRAERDAIWKDLSFTAAHKLGNPIFALETDLQGLKRRVKDGAAGDALKVANEMGVSLEKAKVIIEQFKSLTKAQEISQRPIDIIPLIESACRIAQENGAEVNIRVPDEHPQVMADPSRIAECFDELVANALHWFDKPEKKIAVAADTPKKKEIPAGLDQSQRYLRVRFEDNGCGVPLDSKERIFAPFYTTHPHGTGLGLSLVQRVIEGHRGLIQETGKPGEGALFEIYLPLASKTKRGE